MFPIPGRLRNERSGAGACSIRSLIHFRVPAILPSRDPYCLSSAYLTRPTGFTVATRRDASEMKFLAQATYRYSCVLAARFQRKMRSARHVSHIKDGGDKYERDDRLPAKHRTPHLRRLFSPSLV